MIGFLVRGQAHTFGVDGAAGAGLGIAGPAVAAGEVGAGTKCLPFGREHHGAAGRVFVQPLQRISRSRRSAPGR